MAPRWSFRTEITRCPYGTRPPARNAFQKIRWFSVPEVLEPGTMEKAQAYARGRIGEYFSAAGHSGQSLILDCYGREEEDQAALPELVTSRAAQRHSNFACRRKSPYHQPKLAALGLWIAFNKPTLRSLAKIILTRP
jgi:hypothetical protein